jgi:two-component system response regulator
VPNEPWILVAEDNDDDYALIRRSVPKLSPPITIRRGANGEEVLGILEGSPSLPLVALLDIKMPKMSGLEVLQSLRQNPTTRFLPAVMLTSSDQPTDVTEAYTLGCNAYLRKPIAYDEFVEAIRSTVAFWLNVRVPFER